MQTCMELELANTPSNIYCTFSQYSKCLHTFNGDSSLLRDFGILILSDRKREREDSRIGMLVDWNSCGEEGAKARHKACD